MQRATIANVVETIDGHAHLYAEPDYVERHIEVAERLGIRRTVVSGLGKAWGMLDNDATLAAAERNPDRLIPLAFVLLGRDKPAFVARAKRRGFKGLKFTQPLFPYDDERAFPFYEAAEASGMPALFHCGVLAHAPGVKTSSEFMRPMRLDGVARRFPGLRILIAHLGVPEYEVAATLARIVTNIYVDMTGSPSGGWYTAKSPQFIRSLFHWPTWHRKLIFGTDVRWDTLPDAVRAHARLLSAFRLTPEMRASIHRDNAREFLGEIERTPYESVGMVVRREKG